MGEETVQAPKYETVSIKKGIKKFFNGVWRIGWPVIITGASILYGEAYHWVREQTSAYSIDLNGDRRTDLLLQNRLGEFKVFLQEADETYSPLSHFPKETRDSVEERLE